MSDLEIAICCLSEFSFLRMVDGFINFGVEGLLLQMFSETPFKLSVNSFDGVLGFKIRY